MTEDYAKSIFPAQYSKIERLRHNALTRLLNMDEINLLLALYFNNEPLFESIECFYNEEYKDALKKNVPAAELEKMQKFRSATEEEVNMLYSDIHAREDKIEVSNTPSD